MQVWLKSLPKATFVALVLSVGVLYIVLSDPPKNLCDAQIDQFIAVSKGVLTLDPKKPSRKVTRFQELFELCKTTKTPGGCYELFAILKLVLKNSRSIEPSCYSKLSDQSEFETAVWSSLDLLVNLAWGDKPPAGSAQKQGWLDAADISLFCSLKDAGLNVFGKERYDGFQEKYFTSLPETKTLQRNEIWSRMIFSVNCGGFQ